MGAQIPFAHPGVQSHLYESIGMSGLSVESVQVAPLTHGLLIHSSMSMSQFPSVCTAQTVEYAGKPRLSPVQMPLAQPPAQVHLYEAIGMDGSLDESAQYAPF